jgi:aryl-alcohol dehydrogenase-like predicted oxidoreductase
MRIIDTLVAVADEQGAKPAEVALAWLIGREGVTSPHREEGVTQALALSSRATCSALRLSAAARAKPRTVGRVRRSRHPA